MDAVSCRAVSRMERKLNLSLTAGIFCGWVGFFALIASPLAYPQQYPLRPVRIIVPTAPGGGADLVGRVLAQKLTRTFGQSFVVDNRGGAGTTLGTDLAAKSPADGHTLVLEHVSLAFNVSYYRHLPYDTFRDFAPIALVASQPYIVVVHPSLPVKSVAELLALARARPASIAYSSGGPGSGPFMGAELIKSMTHIQLLHVPYRGAGLAFTDLISGQVQMMVATVSLALPHIRAGRVRALAATSAKRIATMPELPTMSESGVRGFDFSTWYGLLAPAGTPRPIVGRLSDEIARIVDDPEIRERFAGDGIEPMYSSAEAFVAFLARDVEKWAKVVKAAGLRAD